MDRPVPTLTDPKDTIEILKKYNFSFQKKYGQNFLIDSHVMDKIVTAADIRENDFVVEIGPGIGTLTQQLAYRAGHVYAIEIDSRLMTVLEDTLENYDNVTVLNADVMKTDLRLLAERENGGRPIKVVANLPYYITTPMIMGLFEQKVPVSSAVLMVQKEVADRMRACPGTKDYGALSPAVQYYAKTELVANVPPNCFMPRPNVGSAVISLSVYGERPVHADDEELMFGIIKAAFGQRRKTLSNSLFNSGELSVPKEATEAALRRMDLDTSVRGEALSLAQFAELSDLIGSALKETAGSGKGYMYD